MRNLPILPRLDQPRNDGHFLVDVADVGAEEELVLALLKKTVAERGVAADRVEAAAGGEIAVQIRVFLQKLRDSAGGGYRPAGITAAGFLINLCGDLRPERHRVANESRRWQLAHNLLQSRQTAVIGKAVQPVANPHNEMKENRKPRVTALAKELDASRVVHVELRADLPYPSAPGGLVLL